MSAANIDFNNTEVAFRFKSDRELKKASYLFSLMNNSFLVNASSKLALTSLKLRLPIEGIVRATIYDQFCGGRTLLECQPTIDNLAKYGSLVILDYGAEGKSREEDFNKTMNHIMTAAQFAAENKTVPVVSAKITGLAKFDLLAKVQTAEELSDKEQVAYKNAFKRLDSICFRASETGVGVFIDAEESWIQNTIDFMVRTMMERYNHDRAVVYNTYQLYRHDHLQKLKDDYEEAQAKGYILGAKLVRGAYMDKERNRAEEMGYLSPIQPNKEATDRDYNAAIDFCVRRHETIASCAATHNAESTLFQAKLIEDLNLPKDHPHLNFCQLYGMSDNLTFNIADAGYNVAKYLPYGPVRDVIPYLIRRAQENTSVTGDMSRELALVKQEIKRRGI